MLWFYPASCAIALVACLLLAIATRTKPDPNTPEQFHGFQRSFMFAWAVCASADWLQGPYTYALYAEYGYTHDENATLFVAGFTASFIFGTFVAGFADTIGRKRAVLLYCLLYITSCLTKHVNNYNVLLLGRVLGGIATSLLFSAFESWLVSEHIHRHNFPRKLLASSFSAMYFVNFLVAISAGLVSDRFVAASKLRFSPLLSFRPVGLVYYGGLLTAFDTAIVALLIGGIFVAVTWEENHGNANGMLGQIKSFGRGTVAIFTNAQMAMCCAIIAIFESSMYIFIFNWTPVLYTSMTVEAPPFGMVFSTFMMCCMMGASFFSVLGPSKLYIALIATLCLATGSMIMPAFVGMSEALAKYNLWSFLIFEMCVGIYFPAISTLKSQVVPERERSTIYNLFRAPMNLIVIFVLLKHPSQAATFQIVFAMLASVTVLTVVMTHTARKTEAASETKRLVERGRIV